MNARSKLPVWFSGASCTMLVNVLVDSPNLFTPCAQACAVSFSAAPLVTCSNISVFPLSVGGCQLGSKRNDVRIGGVLRFCSLSANPAPQVWLCRLRPLSYCSVLNFPIEVLLRDAGFFFFEVLLWCLGLWCLGLWCLGLWCLGLWCLGLRCLRATARRSARRPKW